MADREPTAEAEGALYEAARTAIDPYRNDLTGAQQLDLARRFTLLALNSLRASRQERPPGDREARAAVELRQALSIESEGHLADDHLAWQHVQKAYDLLREQLGLGDLQLTAGEMRAPIRATGDGRALDIEVTEAELSAVAKLHRRLASRENPDA